MPFTYPYPRPAVTVDLVLIATTDDAPQVLLIRRAGEPFAGRWALPGGFLDLDEELEDAARRELREETGLDVGRVVEIGTFAKVDRDPRGRTLSVAFLALQVGGPLVAPRAGDDASDARWHRWDRLPKLAFDHAEIVRRTRDVLARLAADDELVGLMPGRFTLAELHRVLELGAGRSGDAARLSARLRRTGAIRPTGQRRGRRALYAARRSR